MKPNQTFNEQEVILKLKHRDLKIDLTRGGTKYDPALMNPSHPLYMVTKLKHSTESYLNAISDLFSVLPPGLEVLEFCGGMGLVAEASWDRFQPKSWNSVELDQGCVDAWVSPRAQVQLGDMYDPDWLTHWTPEGPDLIHADWPTNTLRKFWADPTVSSWMDNVIAKRPRYLGITDIETGWIHLPNHWPHYKDLFAEIGITEEALNATDTKQRTKLLRENYQRIFDLYVQRRWGYKVINRTTGGGGEYFLMEAV